MAWFIRPFLCYWLTSKQIVAQDRGRSYLLRWQSNLRHAKAGGIASMGIDWFSILDSSKVYRESMRIWDRLGASEEIIAFLHVGCLW